MQSQACTVEERWRGCSFGTDSGRKIWPGYPVPYHSCFLGTEQKTHTDSAFGKSHHLTADTLATDNLHEDLLYTALECLQVSALVTMYSHEEDIDSAIEVFTQAIQWYQQYQASQTRGANVQESVLVFSSQSNSAFPVDVQPQQLSSCGFGDG